MGIGDWFRRPTVTAFVDDYVLGKLPSVCVVSGLSTPSQLRQRTTVRGPGPAWMLLLLLPPLGWLAFFLVMIGHRQSSLTGHLPLSDDAWADITRLRRMSVAAAVGGFLGLLLAMLAPEVFVPVILALALSAMVGGLLTYLRSRARLPGIELDASGRWVSLQGVHPAFAIAVRGPDRTACEAQHGAG